MRRAGRAFAALIALTAVALAGLTASAVAKAAAAPQTPDGAVIFARNCAS